MSTAKPSGIEKMPLFQNISPTGVDFMFNFLEYMTEMPVYDEATAISGIIMLVFYGIYFLFFGIFTIGVYVLNALPLYKIGKKLGYDKLFLPWIPVSIIPFFVLGDLPGRKDFTVSPKIDRFLKIGTRKKSYILYIVLYVLFLAFVMISSCAMMVFPFLMEAGVLAEELAIILMLAYMFIYIAVVFLSAGVFTALSITYYYVYLRDLLDIFKPDRSSNKTLALILAITNNFASGLVVPIYLLILSKSDPLPEEPFYEEPLPEEPDEIGIIQ